MPDYKKAAEQLIEKYRLSASPAEVDHAMALPGMQVTINQPQNCTFIFYGAGSAGRTDSAEPAKGLRAV